MSSNSTLSALRVSQWLPEWDDVTYENSEFQQPPPRHFYLTSIRAGLLKSLTGVYRRSTRGKLPRILDQNVQRGHEEDRSVTIRDFVKFGYPWCDMSEARRAADSTKELRKPGWLPTAIVVNILMPDSRRNGHKIRNEDLVRVVDRSERVELELPKGSEKAGWQPDGVFPLEVIDGQHRLWAFNGFNPGDDFELPVVAFHGLAPGWQAYLFWSINISPKRINRSLAFDLYPLLRHQSWLDKFFGHSIYRETRCQELVEAIWAHPESPWHQKINMLGENRQQREYKGASVTQAAWIRSLLASLVKQWESAGTNLGGLFGASPSKATFELPWSRPMQAAFLIYAGKAFQDAVSQTKSKWAVALRAIDPPGLLEQDDPAFYGQHSLISTDQGIRGYLFCLNDLCYVAREDLNLIEWTWEDVHSKIAKSKASATDEDLVSAALKSFSTTKAAKFLDELSDGLATYDWRTSSTPGLTEHERLQQGVFRGSSGYREIRRALLRHLKDGGKGRVSRSAEVVIESLGLT